MEKGQVAEGKEQKMSVTGISTANFFDTTDVEGETKKRKAEFDQLGSDIQSGNLSAAQEDYVELTQNSANGASGANSSDPLAIDFSALQNALQSGNLSEAQTAYAQIQQDFQNPGNGSQPGSSQNGIAQDFQSLAQALQSGNLSGAQTAYTTLLQDLQDLGQNGSTSSSSSTDAASATSSATSTGSPSNSSNTLQQDFAALGTALQSGNLSDAQSAFAAESRTPSSPSSSRKR